MRTTLNIDDGLMKKVRKMAADSDRTMTEVIEEMIRREVAGARAPAGGFKLEWTAVAGRTRPGVDLDDRDALIDAMEGRR